MNFEFNYQIDTANKILVCESEGEISDIIEVEHLMKNIIKLAGKNQLKNVVLDVTQLKISCSSFALSNLLIDAKEAKLLGDIKIARIVSSEHNNQYLIGEIASKLQLAIKNFETRSEAVLWLLFNKLPERDM
ncbi:hypothetical protein [Paraglaciecola sp. L3A3]|uniref:hypothetical protein n=1 Tax=Paraglaciecola sp. L3A3 TaxID=2686358 RepID=UPI001E52EBD1|nr:hypothetical protein [Paraglaciecola sp. L3A3]